MEAEKISETLIEIVKTCLNPQRRYEEIVLANVKCTEVIADLEYTLDLEMLKEHQKEPEADSSKIKRILRQNNAELYKLLSMAKGYKATLKNLEYREGR